MRCRRIRSLRSDCLKKVAAKKLRVTKQAEMVTVRLGEFIEVLTAAAGEGNLWLNDFLDEPVTFSNDLREVLALFSEMRREVGLTSAQS